MFSSPSNQKEIVKNFNQHILFDFSSHYQDYYQNRVSSDEPSDSFLLYVPPPKENLTACICGYREEEGGDNFDSILCFKCSSISIFILNDKQEGFENLAFVAKEEEGDEMLRTTKANNRGSVKRFQFIDWFRNSQFEYQDETFDQDNRIFCHQSRGNSNNKQFVDLLIGVKTSSFNFLRRQLIRQTWKKLFGHISNFSSCILFVIGSRVTSDEELTWALHQEQLIYQDTLLGKELGDGCQDSYGTLINKTFCFFNWSINSNHHFSSTSFGSSQPLFDKLMMVDDDVFVNPFRLIEEFQTSFQIISPSDFYVGEILEVERGKQLFPVRDQYHPNYLTKEEFKGEVLPQFCYGPHYILSYEIVRNLIQQETREEIYSKSIGNLEDLSVSQWIFPTNPIHSPYFISLDESECVEDAISIGDLSIEGSVQFFKNILTGSKFCENVSLDSAKGVIDSTNLDQPNKIAMLYGYWKPDVKASAVSSLYRYDFHEFPIFSVISPKNGSSWYECKTTMEIHFSPTFQSMVREDPQISNMLEICVLIDSSQNPTSSSSHKSCIPLSKSSEFEVHFTRSATHTIDVTLISELDGHVIDSHTGFVNIFCPDEKKYDELIRDIPLQEDSHDIFVPSKKTVNIMAFSPQLISSSNLKFYQMIACSGKQFNIHLTHLFYEELGDAFKFHDQLMKCGVKLERVEVMQDGIETNELLANLISKIATPPQLLLKDQLVGLLSHYLIGFHIQAIEYMAKLIQRLSTADYVLSSNTIDRPSTSLFFELSRLAIRPIRLMDLPNPYPKEDVFDFQAVLAPSKFVCQKFYSRQYYLNVPCEISHPSLSVSRSVDSIWSEVIKPKDDTYFGNYSNHINLGVIGRISSEKGISVAIEAFLQTYQRIQPQGFDVSLWIVGDGPQFTLLKEHYGEYKDIVHFLGSMPYSEISTSFFPNIHLLLNPTIIGETFGIAQLESTSHGVPVLHFDMGGNSESVPPFNDLSCKDWSVEGFGKMIEKLVVYDKPWMDFDRLMKGAKWVQSDFSPNIKMRELLDSLNKIKKEFSLDDDVNKSKLNSLSRNDCKVGISKASYYSLPFFQSLFQTLGDDHHFMTDCTFSIIPTDLNELMSSSISYDFFIFSVLDGWSKDEEEESTLSPTLILMLASYRYYSPQSKIILLSGEPIDLSSLSSNLYDILFHTTFDPKLLPQLDSSFTTNSIIYLPNFVTAYAEGNFHHHSSSKENPIKAILEGEIPNFKFTSSISNKNQGSIAYLYSRCDRKVREKLVTSFEKSSITVSKLGVCQGFGRTPDTSKLQNRFNGNYLQDSISIYSNFSFVISSEQKDILGYVSEKMLTPILASSIPIVINSNIMAISLFFNLEGMILCYNEDHLECVRKIKELEKDSGAYDSKLHALLDYERNEIAHSRLLCMFDWIPEIYSMIHTNDKKDTKEKERELFLNPIEKLNKCAENHGSVFSIVDQFRIALEQV